MGIRAGRPAVTFRFCAAGYRLFFPAVGPSGQAGCEPAQRVGPAVIAGIVGCLANRCKPGRRLPRPGKWDGPGRLVVVAITAAFLKLCDGDGLCWADSRLLCPAW